MGSGQMERDSGFEEGVPPGAGGVGDRGEIRLVEPPVGVRPVREHGARVRPVARDDFPARRAGDALEEAEQGLDDFRLGPFLKARGARGPRGVAAEKVLFRRRNVALRPVRQLDVEGGGQRAAGFQLQAGERVDLVGNGGDAGVAHTERLEFQFPLRLSRKEELLPGVDLALVRRRAVDHRPGQVPRPLEARRAREAAAQRECRLRHRQRTRAAVLDRAVHFGRPREQSGGIVVERHLGLRPAVIHPM